MTEKLSEIDKKVLYECDDGTGWKNMIAKELDISEKEVTESINKLCRMELIYPDEGITSGTEWITTEKGKKRLLEND